jgi:RimJ/RimL family protein N-acetyltransferase
MVGAEPTETTRLRLDPWRAQHTALLVRLASIPEVMRHVGLGRIWSPRTAEEASIAQREHWRKHGFGWRAAIEKTTELGVGFMALNFASEGTAGLGPNEYEIGWWLEPDAWGRGFALEGAEALCHEAFGRLAAPSVVARIQPENDRSVDVAVKLGLGLDFETTGPAGEAVNVYRLARADWEGSAARTTRAREALGPNPQPSFEHRGTRFPCIRPRKHRPPQLERMQPDPVPARSE